MRRVTTIILTLAFVSSLSLSFALAESYGFLTTTTSSVGDVDLEPGRYQLQLNSTNTFANIYDGERLVVRTKVNVLGLQDELSNTLLTNRDGQVMEFRSRSERIVFVTEESNKTLASRETP